MTLDQLKKMMYEKIKALRVAYHETDREEIQLALEHAARTMERVLEEYEDKKECICESFHGNDRITINCLCDCHKGAKL